MVFSKMLQVLKFLILKEDKRFKGGGLASKQLCVGHFLYVGGEGGEGGGGECNIFTGDFAGINAVALAELGQYCQDILVRHCYVPF